MYYLSRMVAEIWLKILSSVFPLKCLMVVVMPWWQWWWYAGDPVCLSAMHTAVAPDLFGWVMCNALAVNCQSPTVLTTAWDFTSAVTMKTYLFSVATVQSLHESVPVLGLLLTLIAAATFTTDVNGRVVITASILTERNRSYIRQTKCGGSLHSNFGGGRPGFWAGREWRKWIRPLTSSSPFPILSHRATAS